MKLLKKLLIVDISLFVFAIIFFKVKILGVLLLCFTAALGTYILLECKRIKGEEETKKLTSSEDERRKSIDEKLKKAKSTANSVVAITSCYKFVEEADEQIQNFFIKERALKTIIGLNDGGCGATLSKNSLDVYETIVENYRRISKRVVAYSTTRNSLIREEIEKILESTVKLLDLYNQLINEVSRMGDDFNEQDESLQSLITNLQELRKSSDGYEDDLTEDPFN